MKLSQLFTKTLREVPADEEAVNAQLLILPEWVSIPDKLRFALNRLTSSIR